MKKGFFILVARKQNHALCHAHPSPKCFFAEVNLHFSRIDADSVAGHFFSPAAHKALLLSGLRERKNVIGCINRWGSVRCRVAVPV
jgi:hypothetical protein